MAGVIAWFHGDAHHSEIFNRDHQGLGQLYVRKRLYWITGDEVKGSGKEVALLWMGNESGQYLPANA